MLKTYLHQCIISISACRKIDSTNVCPYQLTRICTKKNHFIDNRVFVCSKEKITPKWYAWVYFKYDRFGYKSVLHNSITIIIHDFINKESCDKLDLIVEQARHFIMLGNAR